MPEPSPSAAKRQSRRELAVSAAAAGVAILLILGLGFIAGRLATVEEQLQFRPPTSSLARLPESAVIKGRRVYVPAYSHIYRSAGQLLPLAITLSVRNTDPDEPIRIDRVRYFRDDGQLLREQPEAPLVLAPMATASFLVEAEDRSAGSGANFLVDWSARHEVSSPVIEAVMIGDGGWSFKSRGEPVEPRDPDTPPNGDDETAATATDAQTES